MTATDQAETTQDLRPIGIWIAVAFAVIAVLIGARTGYSELDVDEAVYRNTLRSMRAGENYYDAHRKALVAKEGAPPSSLRAVRPPTLFLILRWLPEDTWRYAVGVVYLVILLGARKLGARYGRYGGIVAVTGAGLWVFAAAPFLFLHAELWGVPLLMWSAISLRERREGRAVVLLVIATLIRELFGLGILIGLVVGRQKRRWGVGIALVLGLGILHFGLAQSILSAAGREAPLGNEDLTLARALTILSPGEGVVSWTLGMLMFALGFLGLLRSRSTDGAATLLLPFALIMASGSLIATRAYWALTYAPSVAAFVPAARKPLGGRND